jgi:hypothetical protein
MEAIGRRTVILGQPRAKAQMRPYLKNNYSKKRA